MQKLEKGVREEQGSNKANHRLASSSPDSLPYFGYWSSLDELVDYFDLNESLLEEDDVETIGGLVVKLLGKIADVDDVVTFNGLTFTVVEIDGARITKLRVFREPVVVPVDSVEEV